ncbi:hypothetical protein [Dictyobacter formicarum]|uniref:Histidine kinase/HSP90-like ATPase domain-containing protein n=1 Tax=Dictyobacter formicarum TaxID=2778368 RepID=A0ABQ3VBI2_9CHLR|nr:hypothetical protein [Dictyobacter formicarum]GHO82826.1 hypothetical protein KSZ_08320 [Dictyobacter formicarum]
MLEQHNGYVHLQIHDNGKGFNPDQLFPGHLGVLSMQERVKKWLASSTSTAITSKAPPLTYAYPQYKRQTHNYNPSR